MVKVSIRDYMPPYTSWMQVELEEGVCNASPKMGQDATINNDDHQGNSDFNPEIENKDAWDATQS